MRQVWQRFRKEAAVAAPKQTVRNAADAPASSSSSFLAAGPVAATAAGGMPALLPPPGKLVGFTYVSVFVETLTVYSVVGMTNPFLTLSVFSAKGQLVEAAQVSGWVTRRSEGGWEVKGGEKKKKT